MITLWHIDGPVHLISLGTCTSRTGLFCPAKLLLLTRNEPVVVVGRQSVIECLSLKIETSDIRRF
jgi:hypothetical protein